ncbi:hypothetical protein [Defluviimonas sp. SAOS-178_SWC]|uniref:hypothetical protein n=1 Tax=Defluviimonas sp. SAOS-178_SWC TaxID=3121287 RepID=UPI003221C9EB
MNATSPRSFPSSHSLPRIEDDTGRSEKSWCNTFPEKTGPDAFAGIDADRFRDWFIPAFARWLRANFRSPEMVARTFDVNPRTAANWWNGDNRACGDRIGFVFLAYPQAIAWFMAEWKRQEGRR